MGRPAGEGRKTVHLQLSDETYHRLWLICSANDGLGPSAALDRVVGVMNRMLGSDEAFYAEHLGPAVREAMEEAASRPEPDKDGVWSLRPSTAEELASHCRWISRLERAAAARGVRVPKKRDVVQGMVLLYMDGARFGATSSSADEECFDRFAASMFDCESEWEALASGTGGRG